MRGEDHSRRPSDGQPDDGGKASKEPPPPPDPDPGVDGDKPIDERDS